MSDDTDTVGRITFNNGLVRNWETFNQMMEALGYKTKENYDDCEEDVKRGM